jgi:selenocysteine lyase/cysteine desulfurase
MWYGPYWNGPNTYLRTVSASGNYSAVRASLHVMVTAKQVDALIDMVRFMANE